MKDHREYWTGKEGTIASKAFLQTGGICQFMLSRWPLSSTFSDSSTQVFERLTPLQTTFLFFLLLFWRNAVSVFLSVLHPPRFIRVISSWHQFNWIRFWCESSEAHARPVFVCGVDPSVENDSPCLPHSLQPVTHTRAVARAVPSCPAAAKFWDICGVHVWTLGPKFPHFLCNLASNRNYIFICNLKTRAFVWTLI